MSSSVKSHDKVPVISEVISRVFCSRHAVVVSITQVPTIPPAAFSCIVTLTTQIVSLGPSLHG